MENHKVIEFITHPALNQSWLAEQLWGSRDGKYRTRLSKTVSGNRRIKEEEVVKLLKIKEELIKQLQ